MHSFARAARTKYHKLGSFNNRNRPTVLKKSKIKVCAGWVPSESWEVGSAPGLTPSFWCFSGHLGIAWLLLHHPCLHTAFHHVRICVQISLFYKDTSHIGLGATLLDYDLILTNCISNNPISK